MKGALVLRAGSRIWPVDLNESATAGELLAGLSFGLGGSLLAWGGMRYFGIGWKWGVERPQRAMEMGDLAYWDVGSALCLFLGQTPLDDTVSPPFTAPSDVSVVGRVGGDRAALAALRPGTRVQLVVLPDPGDS